MKRSLKSSSFPAVLLLFVFAAPLALWAQAASPGAAPSAAPGAAAASRTGIAGRQKGQSQADAAKPRHRHFGGSFLTPQAAHSNNLVAAEDEDDYAVYRHSASVRAIGEWLHLGPEGAARAFEYLNFLILAVGLLFLFIKYVPGMMRTNRETIQKHLLEARAATEQANARLADVEQRFARLDQEIAVIRTQAERDAAAEEVRIKALMEAERQRIVFSAEREIAAAASAARRDLKRFAGELAIDRAIRRISLDETGDRALMRQFVQELGDEPRLGGRN